MNTPRVFFVGIPVATYYLYLSNNTVKNNQTFSSLVNVQASERCLQLEQVQVLFRHAARTPIKSGKEFDNFSNLNAVVWDKEKFAKVLPHVDIDYLLKSVDGDGLLNAKPRSYNLPLLGGCNGGDLTTVGQQEAYEFGNWLASEYITKHRLISPMYMSNDIYVRSTFLSRTVLTAVGIIAGLYGKDNISEPVSIHSTTRRDDKMCSNWSKCAKLRERYLYHWNEPKYKPEDINKEMGRKDGTRLFNYMEIYDIISQRKHHGLFVPKYLLDKETEIAQHALSILLDIIGNNVDQIKNTIGSFVETVCCQIDEAIEGTCKSKMILYSSHDSFIVPFLIALGIYDYRWQPFMTNVIIELYRDENGERFIRVLHNCNVVILDKESGEEFLPVEKFMKLVEKYRVVNWDEDCGNKVD